jgi:MFS family permease
MQCSSAVAPDDAIYRKIARRIVPFLFICYVVNFIDRVNIGFAKLQFLQDLKRDDAVFGLAAGMFFVGYLVFELPSNLLLERIGVRKTLLRIMVLWGALTVLLMFVRSASMLYLLRFLLGAAEAGFFPGIILYLTYWFPDRQRGRITSLFIMAVPLAGIIGGPLSGWIMVHFHDMLGLRGWQWLFLIKGVPAIVLGIMAMLYLDDRPSHATWLSDAEKPRSPRHSRRIASNAAHTTRRPRVSPTCCAIRGSICYRRSISASSWGSMRSASGFQRCCGRSACSSSTRSAG